MKIKVEYPFLDKDSVEIANKHLHPFVETLKRGNYDEIKAYRERMSDILGWSLYLKFLDTAYELNRLNSIKR